MALCVDIEEASRMSEEEKAALCEGSVEERLAWLDAESNKDDADFEVVDDGQLKIYRLAKIYYDEGQY